jgi:hypothetical protein
MAGGHGQAMVGGGGGGGVWAPEHTLRAQEQSSCGAVWSAHCTAHASGTHRGSPVQRALPSLSARCCGTAAVIGATSPLTYNIVGHLKTVFIMGGGVLFFGDVLSAIKLLGLVVAMCGIVWYTSIPRTPAAPALPPAKAALASKP